ncbi:MAG TPA: STAS domain-containing protein [Baekduia sp.]|nr:STAS domain-containing protein [Baekduia sp.]
MAPLFPRSPASGPGPWFFCLRHAVHEGAVGIVMVGEFDIAAADDAREVIARAQATAPEVICDLHDVSFIDPCGLHVLLDAAANARRHNARLTLANPSAAVRRLIDLAGLEITLRANAVPSAPPPDSRGAHRVRSASRAAKPPTQPRGSLTTRSTPLIVRSSRRAARQDRRR